MKKLLAYILITLQIFFAGNFGLFFVVVGKVHAEIGDIGHWRDGVGGQIPGTGFGAFDFDQEIRNDGIYTKPSDDTIQFSEAGDYLIIATTHDDDNSDGRYNSQLKVEQIAGTGELFTSHYSGYSRDTSEDESWTRAISVVVGASINSQIQVQKRRDTDGPTGGSVVNESDVQVIRLSQTNYGIYDIGGTGNAYGGTAPNTVSIDTIVSESDTSGIEGNTSTDTITVKGDNRKYLVAWSSSFDGANGNRTQRIGHLEYDGVDKLSTRAYCYTRNAANEYCGLGSMDIIETSTADISIQTEVFRGPGVAADQGGANNNGTITTDGNGQMIVLEMPEYLEVFRSEDSVGLQSITTSQTLNISRDVNFNDDLSFTKNSNSLIDITNPSDIFSWANVWTARNNINSGARQTSYGSITLDGIEQTTGRHGNYSRGNQATTDTFALGFNPAGVFTTTAPGSTLGVNTDPIAGGEGGGTDRTQPGTLGFFAFNLDTLVAPELDQSAYRFFENNNSSDVGTALSIQNSAAILSVDNEDFRLRSLISVTQNQFRQNEADFKLQFAEKVGSCDIAFTGETYNDVTNTSVIAFNNNTTPADNVALTANTNDPTNGTTVINQSYQEANNFTTSLSAIPRNQDGLWDFSLIDNTAPDGTSYCFRIVESDDTLLDSYSNIPEITTFTTPVDPAPGGVDTNLALWLKADEGTSTIVDGNTLATWDDQSGNDLDATAVVAPNYRNNDADSLNFNPTIDFNGTSHHMQNLTNGAFSDTYYVVIVPDEDVEGTSSQGVPFGFDCNSGTLSSGTCGLDFGGLALGAFTAAIPDEVITHAIGSSVNWRASKTANIIYPAGEPMLIGINDNPGDSTTNIYEKGEKVDNTVRNTYQTVSNADYSIGRSPDDRFPFYYDGKIAEVINYEDGLSTIDREKIESYLAIKYGITLNLGTQDYIDSDSTTIWSATTGSGYTNNIFGIGRDDNQALGQIKSKSTTPGSPLVIEALGEGTNIANSFSDIADKEFFIAGNNGGANAWKATGAPAGFNILDKTWKAQEAGDVGTTTFEFDVDDSSFDIPDLAVGTNYFFVHDSDNDGSFNDEIPVSMANTSGSFWVSAAVNLSTGNLFTIATTASSNNIPTDIALSNTSINENINSGTILGTLSTTDTDVADTHTYSFVSGTGDDDNTRFVISGSTITVNHSPDHEIQDSYSIRIQTNDGNGGLYQEIFTISIADIGEANTSTIDFDNSEDDDKYTVSSGQWNNNTNNPFAGTNSIESDNLGQNNTQSCFEISHNSNTLGSIQFQYSVSSQAGSDELRFFIDDVQQDSFSGNIPYTLFESGDIAAGQHDYKWCYVKDAAGSAGTDNAYIDDINFVNGASDTTAPTISSTNFASGSLLPGGNHTITLNYSDADSGIDSASTTMQLFKWDGVSSYGTNIAGVGINFNSASTSSASYSTNNLSFGKYQYRFSISDNDGNSVVEIVDFYIDIPEFIIGTGSIDMGTLDPFSNIFSDTVTITVKTIGADFDVTMDRNTDLIKGIEEIPSYDGSLGYGYQQTPYSNTLSPIGVSQTIASEIENINTNGLKNTYTYDIQIGALIELQQAAGEYMGSLDFGISLTY